MTRESKIWLYIAGIYLAYMLFPRGCFIQKPQPIPYEFTTNLYQPKFTSFDAAEELDKKSFDISEAPLMDQEKYKEFEGLINGTVKTDVLTRHQKAELYALTYAKLARKEQSRYNVPACITLAQGILESRSGESKLAVENNNHFGIKCFSRRCKKGHCSNFTDDSHKDFFMKYKSVEQSYRAHSKFLQKPRYRGLKKAKGYKDYARGLQEAGYATGKNYANKLIRIIERYQLYQYDLK